MRLLNLFIIAIFACLCISCGSPRNTTATAGRASNYAMNFERTDKLMPLLDRAKAENKLVFVDVYASWCMPCKMMDREVFTDPALGKFMNDNFINVKIDAEKGNGSNVASIFEVYAYPTLLFLDENGRVLERKVGAAYQTEMRKLANRAIQQSRAVGMR